MNGTDGSMITCRITRAINYGEPRDLVDYKELLSVQLFLCELPTLQSQGFVPCKCSTLFIFYFSIDLMVFQLLISSGLLRLMWW